MCLYNIGLIEQITNSYSGKCESSVDTWFRSQRRLSLTFFFCKYFFKHLENLYIKHKHTCPNAQGTLVHHAMPSTRTASGRGDLGPYRRFKSTATPQCRLPCRRRFICSKDCYILSLFLFSCR